jgi:hypothetical protein
MEIIDLPMGETVTKPGLYRTPLSHYHTQDICPGVSMSSSGLRDVMKCPQYFWRYSQLNPDRYIRSVNHAMIFGRAAHALLLGDEVFDDHYIVSPYDSFRTKEAKEWKAMMELNGMAVLTEKDMYHIGEMSKNLNNEPIIKAGLLDGEAEVSMIWEDRETGIWLKSRVDLLPADGFLSDLKTTGKCDPKACFYKTRDMRYDCQMALGAMGMRELQNMEIQGCGLIYVESSEPYMSYVQDIDKTDLDLAEIDIRVAINTTAECLASGDWPGFTEGSYKHPLNQGDRNG